MGVYIKCPQCGEELNHDDEAYHLSKDGGDRHYLNCNKCDLVVAVKLEAEFEEIGKIDFKEVGIRRDV